MRSRIKLSMNRLALFFILATILSLGGLFLNQSFIPQKYFAYSTFGFLSLASLIAGINAIEKFARKNEADRVAEYLRGLIISMMAGLVILVLSELKGADILSWTYYIQIGPVVLMSAFFIVVGGYAYVWSFELEERAEEG